MLKKLPIGVQTFSQIIEDDLLYTDKTKSIHELLGDYKYVFLSRPRRFGKSLLIDTIHEVFNGNKDLFDGLYIRDKWDWSIKNPVVDITFNGGVRSKEALEFDLMQQLSQVYRRYEIEQDKQLPGKFQFSELIIKLQEKFDTNVVILIDEYDKPILDNLHNLEVAKIVREELKDFYAQIKYCDRYVKFAMLTGVTKFSKVSLFSGLNNLKDISLIEKYGDICGYTHNDLETVFEPYLKDVDMGELQMWYNGYNFLGTSVYNPFDILLFIDNDRKFQNYWFETGTPSFLVQLIKQNRYFLPKLNNCEVDGNVANSFDLENLHLETVMLQAGYLTIKKVLSDFGLQSYILGYPNREVEISFNTHLINYFFTGEVTTSTRRDLYSIFNNGKVADLEPIIKKLFASIAYNNFTKNDIANYEGFYASVIYAYFASLGVNIISEDVTNHGRIDMSIVHHNRTYIFEFKVMDESPLKQIKEKKHYEKYSGEVYLIGIVFDKEVRNVTAFEWELCKE